MGCAPCAKRAAAAAAKAAQQQNQQSNPQPPIASDYTIEQIVQWEAKLECVKNGNLYTEVSVIPSTVNLYLGTLKTIINNPSYAGNYESTLDAISTVMVRINLSGLC